ncbi:long-chain fatty acid--CoA ligase [Nocardioides sp. NPDC051685]|uniref:long-chain fatty acid--CoA ligase n=1 Tax=Nocardioides sp. NPDC051685 TaxID=3364334 RepID=UPI0037ACD5D3
MHATMQHHPLGIADLFEHGERIHADATVTDYQDGALVHRTFAEVADESRRLATALAALGIGRGDVVATLCWNTSHHIAAYFAVPGMGAVLHTLNLRLHASQLSYIARHAEDQVVLVDADLLPLLTEFLAEVPSVRHVVCIGAVDLEALDVEGVTFHLYDDLVEDAEPMSTLAVVEEDEAAVLCYTTGTTGDPKGVAYSHRSTYLHTLMISTGSAYGFSDADTVLPVVPMFHANAWGWVHAAWIAGARLVMSGRYLQAPHLAAMIEQTRPTMLAAVPTIWSQLGEHAHANGVDLAGLRVAVSGGSPLSPSLARQIQERNGLQITQGWGMTETSPLLTYSRPPAGTSPDEAIGWTTRSGRVMPGVRVRIVDEQGVVQPWDGQSQGEVEVAGVTVTGSYLGSADATKFDDGWLRTGDLGVIHPGGWVQLKDRLKDGIKSGGEWISSVELENAIADHPAVSEAAVIGIPDPKWEERPHAFVVGLDGAELSEDELVTFLSGRVAKWWIPDRWTFTSAIPRTSVGKPDKNALRASSTSV